jgi:hypothetical protein
VFDLTGRAEFFQQPEDTLRAGVVEVMERQHGILGYSMGCKV